MEPSCTGRLNAIDRLGRCKDVKNVKLTSDGVTNPGSKPEEDAVKTNLTVRSNESSLT